LVGEAGLWRLDATGERHVMEPSGWLHQ
jgi:hypothetical protein